MPVQSSNVVLDSGAFSADQQNTTVDVYEYIDYIVKNEPDVYFNLDVIGDAEGSWKNQEIMENEGLHPLPVFHVEDDMKYLHRCVAEYDYFALGGMAGGVSEQARQRFLDTCWDIICDTEDSLPKCKVHGLGLASPSLVARYPWYCMTEEDHTVLTKDGWKGMNELSINTEILCFDNGKSVWQPIMDLPIFPVKDIELNHMYNRNFDSYTSDNHRWCVKKRGNGYVWKTANQLVSNDVIPRDGKYTFPTKKVLSDEQVSLLAWFWTDGSIKGRSKYQKDSIVISQSDSANHDKCEIIRNLLIDSGEKYCEMKPSGASHIINFELYGEISEWLLEFAPEKVLPISLPLLLTKEQSNIFIKYSIMADGYAGRLVREDSFGISVKRESKKQSMDVLRTICLLCGIPTSISESNEQKMLLSSSVHHIYYGNVRKERVKYSGNLWCVQVKSGAFFTKCNDKIYVTGNSIDTASGIHYGRYGIIIIPVMDRKGKPDYKKPPYTIYVTERSTAQKVAGKHFKSVSPDLQRWIRKYIKSRGFTVGKTSLHSVAPDYVLQDNEKYVGAKANCKIERVDEVGVFSDGVMRDYFNIDFYMQMEKEIPAYPWPYKSTAKGLF